METNLFVYGTLLKGMPSRMAARLQEEAAFIGEGYVSGILVDLGRYPGVVLIPGAETRVYGHIFRLFFPEKTILELDRYEDVGHGTAHRAPYRREIAEVRVGDAVLPCWVYVCQMDYSGLPVISGGDYRSYLAQGSHPKHWKFMQDGEDR